MPDHLVPRTQAARVRAGGHSTLHGVVFAFLCLDTCGVRAIQGCFPQNRHPPEAKKPLRKAGLRDFGDSQPLASGGFGR
jgi:hypothetical protein